MRSVQSVERAFEILLALVPAPARITELAAAAGLPKSTVARLLVTLERVGAVERVGGGAGRYRIGPALTRLSVPLDFTSALVAATRPHLARLAATLGEAADLSVPEGYTMHYLAQVESPHPIQVRDFTGMAVPMHVGSAGVLQMAHWPEAELSRYLTRPLDRYTPRTLIEPPAIRERLARVRADGYAWVHEEFAEGLSSVAAPIFDIGGVMLGAITVHGPSFRFPRTAADERRIGETVRLAGERVAIRREVA